MTQRRLKYFHLGFLFLFLFSVSLINFFHTEKTYQEDKNCPACNFLNSSLATSQIHFFSLPPLALSVFVKLIPSFEYNYLFSHDPSSRSPPHF
jgi:hypothetical protein